MVGIMDELMDGYVASGHMIQLCYYPNQVQVVVVLVLVMVGVLFSLDQHMRLVGISSSEYLDQIQCVY